MQRAMFRLIHQCEKMHTQTHVHTHTHTQNYKDTHTHNNPLLLLLILSLYSYSYMPPFFFFLFFEPRPRFSVCLLLCLPWIKGKTSSGSSHSLTHSLSCWTDSLHFHCFLAPTCTIACGVRYRENKKLIYRSFGTIEVTAWLRSNLAVWSRPFLCAASPPVPVCVWVKVHTDGRARGGSGERWVRVTKMTSPPQYTHKQTHTHTESLDVLSMMRVVWFW